MREMHPLVLSLFSCQPATPSLPHSLTHSLTMKPSTLLLLTTPALTHSHGIFWSPASRAVLSEQSGYMSDATSIIRCAPLTHSLTHSLTHILTHSHAIPFLPHSSPTHTQLPLNSTTHPLTHTPPPSPHSPSLTHSLTQRAHARRGPGPPLPWRPPLRRAGHVRE
jgi:hypothetical protein